MGFGGLAAGELAKAEGVGQVRHLGVMPHPSDRKDTVTLCLWLVWRMTCSSPVLLLLSLISVSC